MIAPLDTRYKTDYGPSGLHGYSHLDFPEPTPAFLGDVSPQDVGLIETLTQDAQQAFESTQPSATAAAMYGGGNAGLIPPGVNAGSISFGGSTGILLLVGLGFVAFAFRGGRKH